MDSFAAFGEFTWLYALLGAILLAQVLAFLWLRTRGAASADGRVPDADRLDPDSLPAIDGESRDCPACGAANDAEFTFCRNCVADLSQGGLGGRSAARVDESRTR